MKFTVYGEPHGKARPRFANGHAYTPKSTVNYERWVQAAYMDVSREIIPADQPVMVTMDIYHALPKSTPKSKVDTALRERPMKKPDIDNCIKSVLDSLNGLAYADDKQVVAVIARKFYAIEGRVDVKVEVIY